MQHFVKTAFFCWYTVLTDLRTRGSNALISNTFEVYRHVFGALGDIPYDVEVIIVEVYLFYEYLYEQFLVFWVMKLPFVLYVSQEFSGHIGIDSPLLFDFLS